MVPLDLRARSTPQPKGTDSCSNMCGRPPTVTWRTLCFVFCCTFLARFVWLVSTATGHHADSHGSGTMLKLASLWSPSSHSTHELVDELLQHLQRELKPVDEGVLECLQRSEQKVVAVGSVHSMFNQQRILGNGKSTFTQVRCAFVVLACPLNDHQTVSRSILNPTSCVW